jgi:hypothetical protein
MIPFDMKLKLLDWITFILFAQENLAMLLTFSSSMMGAVAILGLMAACSSSKNCGLHIPTSQHQTRWHYATGSHQATIYS